MTLTEIDWMTMLQQLVHLLVAYLLALPIGWERENRTRSAGLRTFPLVAMASCGYILIGAAVLEGSQAQARILYGLITGIGFIGGGAILKYGATVSGTATAAAIWTTGAIGAAVGWQRYEIAVVLSVVTFITLRAFSAAKHKPDEPGDKGAGDESEESESKESG